MDDERAALREIRGRFHFGVFAGGGYGFAIENPDTFEEPYLNGMGGVAFSLGAFIRQNFAYRVGYQLRLAFSFLLGSGAEVLGDGTEAQGSLIAFETALEPSLKFGPMGQSFPLYIDLGAYVGLYHVGGTAGEGDRSLSVSSTGPLVGAVGGLGFIFGSLEQFDLGFRCLAAAPVTGYFSISGMLMFTLGIL